MTRRRTSPAEMFRIGGCGFEFTASYDAHHSYLHWGRDLVTVAEIASLALVPANACPLQ